MDEPKRKPDWLGFAIIIALVVLLVIAALVLLGPQIGGEIGTPVNINLWLHVVGL
jgi:hypothetical protein